ncbi:MAG: HD domain-containing protein [Clostridia bacterium]|nr:HD domain-containing protein [Clostridia bacterium]MBR6745520.1 HD domain-containing protein [Clostridia bacterium]
MMITFEEIRKNLDIKTYIKKSDDALSVLGFTEHSFSHVLKVSDAAAYILTTLGYSDREVELVKIAGYMHDIGNLVNRIEHSQSGAVMAFRILDKLGMETEDLSDVIAAIGNHDEGTGVPISPIAAALILADKSDVRRSRVRNRNVDAFDIHDRVNYSVQSAELKIDEERKNITLLLRIDDSFSSVMEFFEIFMERMILCRKAAEKLQLRFQLNINGQNLI